MDPKAFEAQQSKRDEMTKAYGGNLCPTPIDERARLGGAIATKRTQLAAISNRISKAEHDLDCLYEEQSALKVQERMLVNQLNNLPKAPVFQHLDRVRMRLRPASKGVVLIGVVQSCYVQSAECLRNFKVTIVTSTGGGDSFTSVESAAQIWELDK